MKRTIDVSTAAGSKLTTIEQAAILCRMAEEAQEGEIILDFADVEAANAAFVSEYIARKEICSKIVDEVNLSFWVNKTF